MRFMIIRQIVNSYRTSDGINVAIGRLHRSLIDNFVASNPPPLPPVERIEVFGDFEDVPKYDDPDYQAAMIEYHSAFAHEQVAVVSQAIEVYDIDLRELNDLLNEGIIQYIPEEKIAFLLYIVSDRDLSSVIELIMYNSTVTEQGIEEAEQAFKASWNGMPVKSWSIPKSLAEFSYEYEARSTAHWHKMTWREFCEETGPEQSALVAHYRISRRIEWLEVRKR